MKKPEEPGGFSLASVGSETRIALSTPKSTPPHSVGVSGDGAWDFTRAISPRSTVRVAAVDAYGEALNVYTGVRRIAHSAPFAPWAVYLAGPDQRYRLLGFDFDVKAGDAGGDAARFSAFLTDVGIEHIVCASGPTGGRHIWTSLVEPLSAGVVQDIAYLVRELCPSLDVNPLTNPSTGCLRPPGAPHRYGGHSEVLQGDISVLSRGRTSPEAIQRLVSTLSARSWSIRETAEVRATTVPQDSHGHPYIPGLRRSLPRFAATALRAPAALGDASTVLWSVLIGAAAAHWHLHEVAELVADSPGLEHVRSVRDRESRTPRPARGPASTRSVLVRQWKKAVHHVATRKGHTGEDPTFDSRADRIAREIRAVQDRARATGGRWAAGGGPADRRVLDALCLLALKAMTTVVEADTRRLALLAGVGRETARTALLRLARDGWVSQRRGAEGPHGAHWAVVVPASVIHMEFESSRSQAVPRPAGPALRSTLLHELEDRLNAGTHDVFTPSPGLGFLAGNTYAQLLDTPLPLQAVAHRLGVPAADALFQLSRLVRAGIAREDDAGWSRRASALDSAAALRGVGGRLQGRARRYAMERELWAWWQAEKTWMDAPRRTGANRRPTPGQGVLVAVAETSLYGAHPRRADGRADYRRARQLLIDNPELASAETKVDPSARGRGRRRAA